MHDLKEIRKNFEQFIKWGVISPKDVDLFKIVDDVNDAFSIITSNLSHSE